MIRGGSKGQVSEKIQRDRGRQVSVDEPTVKVTMDIQQELLSGNIRAVNLLFMGGSV